MSGGLAHSVQVRLITHAQTTGQDPNLVLARYAIERLLFRLSASAHADRFVLKGAFMLLVWLGESLRPTRDADVLGFGDLDADDIRNTFADICSMDVEPDGLTFDIDSIRVAPIRHEDAYGGRRVKLMARLGPARIPVQIDIGVGDAVFPAPEWIHYPTLLDLPQPRIRAYRKETAIAEKVHAMITLGSQNSRLRDFFDVHALASRESFDGGTLATAIRTTFDRRGTTIPTEPPIAFSPGPSRSSLHSQVRLATLLRRAPHSEAPGHAAAPGIRERGDFPGRRGAGIPVLIQRTMTAVVRASSNRWVLTLQTYAVMSHSPAASTPSNRKPAAPC